MANFRKLYRGQAVLIVLLIMVVALTVGISISTRSTKDIRQSTRTEESQRAFSAAEAGLEAALVATDGSISQNLSSTDQEIKYTANKAYYGSGTEFIFPEYVERDDTSRYGLSVTKRMIV